MNQMQIHGLSRFFRLVVGTLLLHGHGVVVLAQIPPNMPDTRPAYEAMREGKYLQALSHLETHDPNHEMVKQELATIRSFVGDFEGALAAFGNHDSIESDKIAELASQLQSAVPLPALDTIVEAAKDQQIVILNEAHHVPRHRAFALELVMRLRELGFDYFAAETFAPLTDGLQQRGYPDLSTGFYSNEPVFGELIRTTLQLGYRPIAYEMLSMPPTDADQVDQVIHRETEQCNNLCDRIFKEDPQAKVFIFVGYSHATEDTRTLDDGREMAWMAARLKKATGIDPLTIDQTMPADFIDTEQRINPWQARLAKSNIEGPVVFRQDEGPFLVQGMYAGKVDLQVIHPPTKSEHGRPSWLLSLPDRRLVDIPEVVLRTKERVLVQAFVESEPDTAIPADQVILIPGLEPPKLALRTGSYRIIVQSENGTSTQHGQVKVGPSDH